MRDLNQRTDGKAMLLFLGCLKKARLLCHRLASEGHCFASARGSLFRWLILQNFPSTLHGGVQRDAFWLAKLAEREADAG